MVIFRIEKSDRHIGVETMLNATFALLRELPCDDLALVFNGEEILLTYSHSELSVNAGTTFWRPEWLEAIPLAYRFSVFPNL